MRILLIDDEVRKAQSLISYFEEVRGWGVMLAAGPAQALEYLGGEVEVPFDLIILDIMMDPGTVISRELSDGGRATGLALLELIFERTKGRIRVVVYTARTDLESLSTDSRVAAYIQKPRTVREVAQEIDKLERREILP